MGSLEVAVGPLAPVLLLPKVGVEIAPTGLGSDQKNVPNMIECEGMYYACYWDSPATRTLSTRAAPLSAVYAA